MALSANANRVAIEIEKLPSPRLRAAKESRSANLRCGCRRQLSVLNHPLPQDGRGRHGVLAQMKVPAAERLHPFVADLQEQLKSTVG